MSVSMSVSVSVSMSVSMSMSVFVSMSVSMSVSVCGYIVHRLPLIITLTHALAHTHTVHVQTANDVAICLCLCVVTSSCPYMSLSMCGYHVSPAITTLEYFFTLITTLTLSLTHTHTVHGQTADNTTAVNLRRLGMSVCMCVWEGRGGGAVACVCWYVPT